MSNRCLNIYDEVCTKFSQRMLPSRRRLCSVYWTRSLLFRRHTKKDIELIDETSVPNATYAVCFTSFVTNGSPFYWKRRKSSRERRVLEMIYAQTKSRLSFLYRTRLSTFRSTFGKFENTCMDVWIVANMIGIYEKKLQIVQLCFNRIK